MMMDLARKHLTDKILPFWSKLKDDVNGGFYGYMDYNLEVDKKAVKGCILNSRILWFYSNAYLTLKDESLLAYAKHAFEFMKNHCLDKENGGIFWSLNCDGSVFDDTKHTYNQAFAIYALCSYYDASKEEEALNMAFVLVDLIESKCTDSVGYLEAFNRKFEPVDNDKLSENGVIAHKTMNTLLHVLEAYTECYRVSKNQRVKERLYFMLDTIIGKIYNPQLHRQEVFFDENYNSILDLHSYGHDIETAWLVDRTCELLADENYTNKLLAITKDLTKQIYEVAYQDHSLLNECDRGEVNSSRIWWVQAEAVVGFINGYEKDKDQVRYLDAARDIFDFILTKVVDKRAASEWYWEVDKDGKPFSEKPIVEPWKCPYHNGRMCFELIKRNIV